MEKKDNTLWYNSGNKISSLIIAVIVLIVLCSQSFAGRGNFASIINDNITYLLIIVYFISLKTKMGKKYFNYLNLFLISIFFLLTITSFLTIFQSFYLTTSLNFIINLIFTIYLVHTMFRDTRVWKDFHLNNSPFNELNNETYFYALVVLNIILLSANLIFTVVISGIFISVLETIYSLLLARYVFLYGEYLDANKKDIDNNGNFDEIKKNIKDTVDDAGKKINDYIEDSNIDEKINDACKKVADVSDNVVNKINDFIDDVVEDKSDDKEKTVKDTKSSKKNNSNKKGGKK